MKSKIVIRLMRTTIYVLFVLLGTIIQFSFIAAGFLFNRWFAGTAIKMVTGKEIDYTLSRIFGFVGALGGMVLSRWLWNWLSCKSSENKI